MDAAGVVVEAGAGGFNPPNSPPDGVEGPDEAAVSAGFGAPKRDGKAGAEEVCVAPTMPRSSEQRVR